VYLYERTMRNEKMAPEEFVTLDQLYRKMLFTEEGFHVIEDEIRLLDGLGITFDPARVRGNETDACLLRLCPDQLRRTPLSGRLHRTCPAAAAVCQRGNIPVPPERPDFSGYVFKIQANLNPKHRDSVAFVRVCSGRFERGLHVIHAQSGKSIRLLRPYKLFANEREIVEEAYPGDVVGIPNNGILGIGDTLYTGEPVQFAALPHFPPEHFALLKNTNLSKQKQFTRGLLQLEKEGSMQVFYNMNAFKREPILGVVGQLQFDVVQARLEVEYNVPTELEHLPHTLVRWVEGSEKAIASLPARAEAILARDTQDRVVVIFKAPYLLKYYSEKYPDVTFKEMG
jgi:peptide chain release factor 3